MKVHRFFGCCGVFSLGLLLVACGSSSTDAENGSGGTGSGGSDSGGTGPSNQPPGCLLDLFAACPLADACAVEDVNGDGSLLRSCYDSGVLTEVTAGTECQNREVMVYKADGSLCYSYEVLGSADQDCEGAITVWRDSDGAVVATGSQGQMTAESATVNLTCRIGETTSCELTASSTCGDVVGPGPVCDEGECAAP